MSTKPSPPWLVPNYPPLKGDDPVGKAAVDGQLVYYPKVVRSQIDDPIHNQTLGCISFMYFSEPRKLRNGKLVYGFFKLRGNWPNQTQATRHSSKIIREMDSRYQIRVAPVGHWLPLTEEDAFCKEKTDVRMKKEEKHLRDQAFKDKLSRQRQVMREIREREEELQQEGDVYDDPTSLAYYSMRRVTEWRLTEARDRILGQLESTEGHLRKVRRETKKLELKYPEYLDQWLDRYNEERKKGGLPDFIPSEDLFKEYDETKLEELRGSEGPSEPDSEEGPEGPSEPGPESDSEEGPEGDQGPSEP